MLPCYRVLPSFSRWRCYGTIGFGGNYVTEFYRVLPSFTEFFVFICGVSTGRRRDLPSFTEFYRVLPSFLLSSVVFLRDVAVIYRVLPSFSRWRCYGTIGFGGNYVTEFYRVLPSFQDDPFLGCDCVTEFFTELYRVFFLFPSAPLLRDAAVIYRVFTEFLCFFFAMFRGEDPNKKREKEKTRVVG